MTKGKIIILLVVLAAASARAEADGCFVWRKGVDINEPNQKAIIFFDAGKEDLILQVKYSGPVAQFGWLVPVPGKPTVEKASMKCFYELSRYFQHLNRYRKGRQGREVKVIERKTVGAYDVAILSASKAGALSEWLRKNKFNWPKDRQDVLDHYVKQKWYFVAVRINLARADDDTAERLRTGELHPLKISFDTKECVYPLKISSVNSGGSEVDVYVIAAKPLVCPNMDFFSENLEKIEDSHLSARALPACRKELPRMKDKKWFILKHTAMFYSDTMKDLTFRPFKAGDTNKLKQKFLRRYISGRNSVMMRELAEIEREAGRNLLYGAAHRSTGGRFMLIQNRMKVLSEVAPKRFVELALSLIEDGCGTLLQYVTFESVQAPIDKVMAAAVERLLERRDEGARGPYWRIIFSAGKKAGPALKVLCARLRDPDGAGVVFPSRYSGYNFGKVMGKCGDKKAFQLVIALLNAKDPKDTMQIHLARSAARALAASSDKRATEPLISHLNGPIHQQVVQALGALGDKRAVEPLRKVEISYAVLDALKNLDKKAAFETAMAGLESDKAAERRVCVDRLISCAPDKVQKDKAAQRLMKLAETEHDAKVMSALASRLSDLVRYYKVLDAEKVRTILHRMRSRCDDKRTRERITQYIRKLGG